MRRRGLRKVAALDRLAMYEAAGERDQRGAESKLGELQIRRRRCETIDEAPDINGIQDVVARLYQQRGARSHRDRYDDARAACFFDDRDKPSQPRSNGGLERSRRCHQQVRVNACEFNIPQRGDLAQERQRSYDWHAKTPVAAVDFGEYRQRALGMVRVSPSGIDVGRGDCQVVPFDRLDRCAVDQGSAVDQDWCRNPVLAHLNRVLRGRRRRGRRCPYPRGSLRPVAVQTHRHPP